MMVINAIFPRDDERETKERRRLQKEKMDRIRWNELFDFNKCIIKFMFDVM